MAVSSLSSQSSIYSIISSLMALERQPLTRLQNQKSNLQTLNGIYTDVKTKLTALRSATTAMTDILDAPLSARAVSSSNSAIVTATAANSSVIGSHSLLVTQLAKSQTLVSNQLSADGYTLRDTLGVGDYGFSITVNGVATNVNVSIGADDTDGDVIAAVASAINGAMDEVEDAVSATALDDTESTSKLVLRSDGTGSTLKMTLADTTGTLLSALGITDSVAATETTGGYIYAEDALDARFTLDGVSITRSSNTISDVLSGVTLSLKSVQETGDQPTELTVSADTSAIRGTIENFISKYNDAVKHLRLKSSVDSSTGARQALAGQFTYTNLLTDLRVTAAQSATTAVSGLSMLADLGITQNEDGTLSLSDADDLESALASNPAAVASVFTATDGIASRFNNLLEPFVKTGGYLDQDKTNTTTRINSFEESIDRMEDRLAVREKKLIAQYTSLQELLAQMSGQADYLGTFLSTFSW